jgi:CelD/BcsL family acetyltransferase involved in cellulose biosynthesis
VTTPLPEDAIDAAVQETPGIDHFCASTPWILSAHEAFAPARELFCRRTAHGWILLARRAHDRGWSSLEPLEASWCLATPFAYEGDPLPLARELATLCAREAPRDVLFLTGIPLASPLERALTLALAERYHVDMTGVPPTRRYRAELAGGLDGFLSRRSPSLRAGLRQADRKATRMGVRFEPIVVGTEQDALACVDRIVALEARSWKGKEGSGLAAADMALFYRLMLPRLARRGRVRAFAGVHEGRDIALIMGGVTPTPEGIAYRGLQFSFDDDYRALSLGNLAQMTQIAALCDEGVALYDLGSEVDYKRRWGERCLETATLVAIPRALSQ